MKKLKTFGDLCFRPHPLLREFAKEDVDRLELSGAAYAQMTFENGFKVSVICGKAFYSDGLGSYEVLVSDEGGRGIYHKGWLSAKRVTKVMEKHQTLRKGV